MISVAQGIQIGNTLTRTRTYKPTLAPTHTYIHANARTQTHTMAESLCAVHDRIISFHSYECPFQFH